MTSDHPRRRGELVCDRWKAFCLAGSSPQARGTLRGRLRGRRVVRIIPAGAGNSTRVGLLGALMTDHPRRRGELVISTVLIWTIFGSSPQARGTPCRESGNPCLARIIPAGAGNSHTRHRRASSRPDHPRRRGELTCCTVNVIACSGSSPQARGTLNNHKDLGDRCRIIPAGAGNSKPAPVPP